MSVDGSVAVITGAGSGIGEGVARALAAAGAHVCIVDLDESRVARVVDSLRGGDRTVEGVTADVSDSSAVERCRGRVLDVFDRMDILVNAAGIIGEPRDIDVMTQTEWERPLRTNLTSQFLCCQSAVPIMKRQQYGRIVNIASRMWLGAATFASYAVSKGGVISLTRSLALELGRHGITVNAVSPGLIDTEMFRGMAPEARAASLQRMRAQPIPRLGTPADVARAILFLADRETGFITGQNIYVGGGAELLHSGTL